MMLGLGLITLVGLTLPGPTAQARQYASIVVDATSGRILHARHIDAGRYPASMTKMMTLYMLFEAIDTGRLSMSSRLRSRRAPPDSRRRSWA